MKGKQGGDRREDVRVAGTEAGKPACRVNLAFWVHSGIDFAHVPPARKRRASWETLLKQTPTKLAVHFSVLDSIARRLRAGGSGSKPIQRTLRLSPRLATIVCNANAMAYTPNALPDNANVTTHNANVTAHILNASPHNANATAYILNASRHNVNAMAYILNASTHIASVLSETAYLCTLTALTLCVFL